MGATLTFDIFARDHASKVFESLASKSDTLGGKLASFGGAAVKALAGVAVAAGSVATAGAVMGIKTAASLEQADIAFRTLLGSGEKASAFLKDLSAFAAKTPFELPGLIENSRMLLGVGVAADKVLPTMGALGNAAGALGLSQDSFNRIMLATTQALGKGKLQGEELLQMVEAGIPVWNLLSKATGKSVPELQKLSEQGKLLSAEVLPKLFDQMNKDYGGAMSAQSQTLIGLWSSLKDNGKMLVTTAMTPLFNESKKVVGALGDLAASDRAKQWASDFALRLEVGISALKRFGTSVQTEFGDDFARSFDTAKDKIGEFWPTIKDAARTAIEAFVKIGAQVGPPLIALATSVSGLLKPAIEGVTRILQALADNADEFGSGLSTMVSVIGAVAGPALRIIGEILKIVASALSSVVHLVGDLSGPLGILTGVVLSGVIAWKALSVVLGGISGLWSKVSPKGMTERLGGMTKTIDNVALSAGVMTERFTGSATAGQRVASAGSKIGSALTKVGAALPVVGLAAIGVGMIFESQAQAAANNARAIDDMAAALLKGGAAAQQAQAQLDAWRKIAADPDSGKGFGIMQAHAKNISEGVVKSMQRQVSEMSNVQRAQQAATQAQQDYDLAIRNFGPGSQQAVDAQRILVAATKDLAREQDNAARAASSHEQSLFNLANQALMSANADLQLRQSRLGVKEAEDALTQAVQQHGVGSLQAQSAELALEGQYLRTAEAAKQKAAADNASAGSTEQAKAATGAYYSELIRMALAAGTNAPPALLRLIQNMDASSLAALEAAAKTGNFKTQVLTLPNGKTVTVAVDDQGTPVLQRAKSLLDLLKDKTITLTVNERRAILREERFGELALGGPVFPQRTYLVGEKGPELFTPDTAGRIIPNSALAGSKPFALNGDRMQGGSTVIAANFSGPVGSRHELMNWLTRALDDLRRQGRLN